MKYYGVLWLLAILLIGRAYADLPIELKNLGQKLTVLANALNIQQQKLSTGVEEITSEEEAITEATDPFVSDPYNALKKVKHISFSKVNRLLKGFLDYVKANKDFINEDSELVNFNELTQALPQFNEGSEQLLQKLDKLKNQLKLGLVDPRLVARLGKEVQAFGTTFNKAVNEAKRDMGTNNVTFMYNNQKDTLLNHWKKVQGNFDIEYAAKLKEAAQAMLSKATPEGLETRNPSQPSHEEKGAVHTEEKKAAQEAYAIFNRLKKTFNEQIEPALKVFLEDIQKKKFNDEHYQDLRNKFVGKISTEETKFHKQASKLRNKLNQISDKDAFSEEQFNEINTLFFDLNNRFETQLAKLNKKDLPYVAIVDIVKAPEYQVVKDILDRLQQLKEEG